MAEIEIDTDKIKSFLQKHWVAISLIIIFFLSFYIRVYHFHLPYLYNIDSYFQLRRMKYIVNGHTEFLTIERNGRLINTTDLKYDPLMLAPNGKLLYLNPYHYLGAYLYMLFRLFIPGLELWKFSVYLPAFIISLIVFFGYLLGKALYDKKAGVLAAFLMAFNPSIMSRTLGGDPDSDCIVLLLPVVVLSLYFLGYQHMKSSWKDKKGILFYVLSGISFTIFALTWVSWYVFYLILGFVVLYSIVRIIQDRGIEKSLINVWIGYLIFLFVFVAIITPIDFPRLRGNLVGPFQSLNLKSETGNFPNVYVSVAELMPGGGIGNVALRAGVSIFVMSILALFFYLLPSYIMKRKHLEPLILLGLWIIAPLYAALVAVRFTILLALPLSLGAAIFLSKIWRWFSGEDKSYFD